MLLAGCQSSSEKVITEQSDYTETCAGAGCAIVRYESPNGKDLVLETSKHVIEIQASADVPYSYYVWAGGKDTTQNPDLIIEDGKSMVLVEE